MNKNGFAFAAFLRRGGALFFSRGARKEFRCLRVYEAEYGEGERGDRVVWERTATLEECSDGGTVLDEETAALWDGLE